MAESSAQVLVVDDNRINRMLLKHHLDRLGHRVAVTENGVLALEALRSGNFDLLLLDIEMPEMDGFEVMEQVRGDPRLRDVPVIVTSSLEGLDNVVRCIALGAEDYLPKPVNPVLLEARIRSSLEKKQLRDQQREMVKRFATSEVAQDLQQSGFSLGGRRMYGTVMFSDIRNFTGMVESQDPEETIALLNAYYALVFDAINAEGGVINQIIGDGLMAIFGAPLPLKAPELAAVSAALAMQRAMHEFNGIRASAGKPELRIGIGIASGSMVAGYTGTQQRATYTCIGDTVNLAARLEAYTKHTTHNVLLDGATAREVGRQIRIESLGEVHFKGKSAAVPTFAALAMA